MSKFKNIGHIGDVNPIDYGGGFILRFPKDPVLTLVYIEPPCDDIDFDSPEARWTVYTVLLVDPGDWVDWRAISSFIGEPVNATIFETGSPLAQAQAICDVASYEGWANFDSYPSQLTKGEVNKRFGRMKTR